MVSGTSELVPFPFVEKLEFFNYLCSSLYCLACALRGPRQMTREITTHSAEETMPSGRTAGRVCWRA